MMGGSQAHEFMVLNPAGEDVLVLCEACGYAANRQIAVVPKPDPAPEEALPAGGGRDAGHDDDRVARRVPRRRRGPDRQGRLLRDRRRPAGHRHRPRRLRRQRDQAGQRGQGDRRHAPGDGRGDQGRRDGARATARRSAPTTRSSSSTTWSRARRTWSPGPTARASTTATSTHGRDFTAGPRGRHHERPEGDRCPNCGEPVILRNGIEVGNIFKLGTKYTDAAGATYLGEDGEPTRS